MVARYPKETMSAHCAREQASSYRQPLTDATNRVNKYQPSSSSHQTTSWISSSPRLPHHESLKPEGNLQKANPLHSLSSSAEHRRLSELASEERKESNRDSQISNASTNASSKGRRKTHIGPWNLGKTLGKGATGRVREARHQFTGQRAAVKIVSKRTVELLRSDSLAGMDKLLADMGSTSNGHRAIPYGIEREVIIMKLIEHPNIISLYDLWENRGELYLVLEYVQGGELFDYIVNNGRLSEQEAVRIFRQIITGLAYCHRFKICHRDLKPENILLDRHHNVKIVDFGLAALQPADRWLRTSCGSPHYAPPEIALGKQYQGDRADIWSCGIILYCMLTGTLPFGPGGEKETLKEILEEVIRGEVIFAEGMSFEAQDLIWKILQKDPNKRISIKEMWSHPLLLRYEAFAKHKHHAARWTGGPTPPLTATDSGPPIRNRSEVDEEILRNLTCLFPRTKVSLLVEALLSPGPSYEKVFYYSLLKYRNEQLENYEGPQIEISTSDYHHIPKPGVRPSSTRLSLHGTGHQRRRSHFSILSEDVHHTSQRSCRQPSVAGTEESYDPYRSSLQQISKAPTDYARITVLRGVSDASRRLHAESKTPSLRHPQPVRVQGDAMLSIPSSPPALPSNWADQNQLPIREHIKRVQTRSSLSSSCRPRSSSAGISTSQSYRRGVRFNHTQKRSTSEYLPSPRIQQTPSPLTLHQRYLNDRLQQTSPDLGSPPAAGSSDGVYSTIVRSRGNIHGEIPTQEVIARNSKTTSHYWKEEARNISVELEKVCDEAFNRSSVASSTLTGTSITVDRPNGRQISSSTSFSDLVDSSVSAVRNDSGEPLKQRPLPELPERQLAGSLSQIRLAETRNILKQRATDPEAGLPPGVLDDVIAHLDRWMETSKEAQIQCYERRVTSAPDPGLQSPGALSPVREEDGRDAWYTTLTSSGRSCKGYRTTSEPIERGSNIQGRSPTRRGRTKKLPTIRIVNDDFSRSISPIRPLVIRKKSGASIPSTTSNKTMMAQRSQECIPGLQGDMEKAQQITLKSYARPAHAEVRKSAGLSLLDKALELITEDDQKLHCESREATTLFVDGKRRGWFRRHQQPPPSQSNDRGPTPPGKDTPVGLNDDVRKEGKLRKRASSVPSEESQTSVTEKERSGTKGKLFKIFRQKDNKQARGSGDFMLGERFLDDTDSVAPSSSTTSQTCMSGAQHNEKTGRYLYPRTGNTHQTASDTPIRRAIEPAPRNWLARFLRIKPATRVFCFLLPKVKARKEIVRTFKQWRRFGMRDIVVDRVRGRLWARVGPENHLSIKPVSLAAEFFTVLDRGRRANLSVVRFTQEKGAKSSFDRVLAALENVLRDRRVLVMEKRKRREMEGCLVGVC